MGKWEKGRGEEKVELTWLRVGTRGVFFFFLVDSLANFGDVWVWDRGSWCLFFFDIVKCRFGCFWA